jgi:hypothetical protein
MTDGQWDALESDRSRPAPDGQPDLFDATVALAPATPAAEAAPAPAASPRGARPWIAPKAGRWL